MPADELADPAEGDHLNPRMIAISHYTIEAIQLVETALRNNHNIAKVGDASTPLYALQLLRTCRHPSSKNWPRAD